MTVSWVVGEEGKEIVGHKVGGAGVGTCLFIVLDKVDHFAGVDFGLGEGA